MFRRMPSVVLLLGILLFLVSTLPTISATAQEEPLATPRPTATPIPPDTGDKPDSGENGGSDGSIRGTVYQDVDSDGICPEDGDPVLEGVPIRFESGGGTWIIYLHSGGNGTYGMVAAGLGHWEVSAEPLANQGVVTSDATHFVFLTSQEKLALGIDFCVSAAAPPDPAGP